MTRIIIFILRNCDVQHNNNSSNNNNSDPSIQGKGLDGSEIIIITIIIIISLVSLCFNFLDREPFYETK